MSFFVSLMLIFTSLFILLISTVTALISSTKLAGKMTADQLTTLASNYADSLDQYQIMVNAMIMDKDIQRYCNKNTGSGEAIVLKNNAYHSLLSALNMQKNMNFAAVIHYGSGDHVYKGITTEEDSQFSMAYEKDYAQSSRAKKRGSIRMNFGDHYYRDSSYTLTIYIPVYSMTNLVEELGMLVVNMNDNLLEQLYYRRNTDARSEMFLMNYEGKIVSIYDQARIGTEVSFFPQITGDSGSFREGSHMVYFARVGNWSYYLVNVIPLWELYGSSIKSMLSLLLVLLVMTVISLIFTRQMVKKMYRPLDQMVSAMDQVSEGELSSRINARNMGTDCEKLALGFNIMMDEIEELMCQVKLEQHQLEQTKFNALQAQIQPHFLYNTLECIHWQAMMEGNKEISTLVKALAQYYRICLNKGKDIISLQMELEHIKNYLVIQNMRYDHIISLTVTVPEKLAQLKIPKLTLQPLIENSIYHGIRVKEGVKGEILITTREIAGDVFLSVADSGTGMSIEEIEEMNRSISNFDQDFGYGVRNVHKRINLMFGTAYGLHFDRNEKGGVTVIIRLPKEAKIDYEEVL